jgi:SanA protein
MKKYRKPLLITLAFLSVFLILTMYANQVIIEKSKAFVTDDINQLTTTKVGLLLGTSKTMKNGSENDFFFNRIDAAVQLYQSGKIKYIIVSGDNSKTYYNEPLDMKTELIKRGIPDSVIHLDYAGFRTLDSVVRAKEIFGQNSYIIISQKFHNERAVYIARRKGIQAFGYNAKEVVAYKGLKTKLREYFARDKVFLDFLFGVEPKFMGERIKID